MFDIRYKKTYQALFPDIEEMRDEDNFDENGKKRQVYKIQYNINLLPRLAEYVHQSEPDESGRSVREPINPGICIMALCVKYGGLDVFDTQTQKNAIEELIAFKWTQFGQSHHMIGLCFHFC